MERSKARELTMKRKKKAASARRFFDALNLLGAYTWWILIPLGALLARRAVFSSVPLAEFYSSRLRPVLMWPLTGLTNFLPTSASLIFLIVAGLTGLVMVLRLVMAWRIRKGRTLYVMNHLRVTAIILSSCFLLYMLFHGMNFARQPLAGLCGYSVRERSEQELYQAALWIRDHSAEARGQLSEDDEGRFRFADSGNVQQQLDRAWAGYEALAERYPFLGGQRVRPKSVPLSNYWSYTGTAGMFFPMLGEANVNSDMRPDEILVAALHEIAHVKGFAREDEANFLAFYTGIEHPDADYQYSAWLLALIQSSNQLYRYNKDLWNELWAGMPEGVARDLAARGEYWDAFKGPVQEKSAKVNNSFLVANGQDDGIRSYGRMVDLLLAYYETEVVYADSTTAEP